MSPTDAIGAGRSTTVVCAVRGALEPEIASVLAAAHPGITVTRRCADIAELLAASAAGLGDVAVISGDVVGLDRLTVAALHGDGVRVVGVLDTADGHQTERMAALGVDAVLDATTVRETLVPSVLALAASVGTAPADSGGRTPAWGLDDTAVDLDEQTLGLPAPFRSDSQDRDRRAQGTLGQTGPAPGRGVLVAVWGPTGAPGRSTTAVNLAAELVSRTPARRSRRRAGRPHGPSGQASRPAETALLVDADTYSGSVAQITGLLDESSGIAAACRAAGQGALDTAALARLCPEVFPHLRVLTGIARAARWPEVSEAALDGVWDGCRDIAQWTVVDCGFSIERDEMLSYDTRAPHRNGATLSALGAADVVVVVGGADPVSLQRLVRALDDLRDAGEATTAARVVVVNRVRASVVGAQPSAVVRDALYRYASVADPVLVPDDPVVCDGALLAGRTFTEHAPGSPVRRAMMALAERVREVAAERPTRPAMTPSSFARPVAH